MAIKMDGHTINSLKLTASDGSTVTKVLTEDGVIPTPTGTKEITENGEVDVLNFAKALVNVATASGDSLPFDFESGTANPVAVNKLYIPYNTEKKPLCFVAKKTTSVSATSPYCVIGFIDVRRVGVSANDTSNYMTCWIDEEVNPTNGIVTVNSNYKTTDDAGKVLIDRPNTSHNFNTGDTYDYIVFYQ